MKKIGTRYSSNDKYMEVRFHSEDPSGVAIRLVYQASYTGWVHAYFYDNDKNFLDIKYLCREDNVEFIYINTIAFYINCIEYDASVPAPDDAETEVSLLGVVSADLIINDINPLNVTLTNIVI